MKPPTSNRGRERAIEALLDLDPNGPKFRIEKVLNEAPIEANLSRPNLITRSALIETALSLSAYQSRDLPPSTCTTETQPITSSSNLKHSSLSSPSSSSSKSGGLAFATPNKPKSEHDTDNKIRDRVMRHHAKIIMSKSSSSTTTNNNVPGPSSVTTSPPPQLVAALRKIYGSNSSATTDCIPATTNTASSTTDSNLSTTGSFLPALLRTLFDHSIFSSPSPLPSSLLSSSKLSLLSTSLKKNPHPSETIYSESFPISDDDDSEEATSSNPSSGSMNIASSILNLETIIGNACMKFSQHENEDESLLGILIAALSILTTCLAENDPCDDNQATTQPSLQVSGPLSLLKDLYNDSVMESARVNNLILESEYISYLMEAASVYEERVEIQKTRLVASSPTLEDVEFKKLDIMQDGPLSTPDNSEEKEGGMNVDSKDDEEYEKKEENSVVADELVNDSVDADLIRPSASSEIHSEDDDDEEENGSEEEDIDQDGHDLDSFMAYNPEDSDRQLFVEPISNLDHDEDEYDDSSSSSSSSSENSEDDSEEESRKIEDSGDESNGPDDPFLLEEALALSLADENNNENIVENTSGTSRDGRLDNANTQEERKEDDKGTSPSESEFRSQYNDRMEAGLPDLPIPSFSKESIPILSKEEMFEISREKNHLNPSSFETFGCIPAKHVFIHLLRKAVALVESNSSSMDNTNGFRRKEPESPCKLGVGSSLFPPQLRKKTLFSPSEQKENLSTLDCNSNKIESLSSDSSIVHVLVALLYLLSDLRSESMNELYDSICGRLNSNSSLDRNDDDDVRESHDEIMDISKESYDETEDPASAISKLSYISSIKSSQDSFVEKGMTRKAADAAHIASLRKEKFDNHVEFLTENLQIYSICSYLTLKCLRQYLRDHSSRGDLVDEHESILNWGLVSISPLTRVRLSTSISTFTSSAMARSSQSLIDLEACCLDSKNSINESILLPKPLLLEGAMLWGEATDLIHASQPAMEKQLIHLIHSCYPHILENQKSSSSPDLLQVIDTKEEILFPWGENDENSLKLDAMCGRLLSFDMMRRLVPGPNRYVVDCSSLASIESDEESTIISPENRLTLFSILSHVVHYSSGSNHRGNINKLYYTLCHHFNLNLLLWNDRSVEFGNDLLIADDIETNFLPSSVEEGKIRLSKKSLYEFDTSKCADSIALQPMNSTDSQGPSATQRANKVWGTVLSTKSFKPKSGIHRWALKLDRCEKGHVFVGVATNAASTKTYVGGDKNGWGVIGTQALWHDRKKIRGDYGKTFRTGAIVVVTLDTDAGTIRYGLLKDLVDPDDGSTSLSTNFKNNQGDSSLKEGVIEDWGIAFEGLPLDSKLHPAVGLYQRDDQVTLLSIDDKNTDTFSGLSLDHQDSGECFYPALTASLDFTKDIKSLRRIKSIRRHNQCLCMDAVSYTSHLLDTATEMLSNSNKNSDLELDEMFHNILPSLASSICLYPSSIPTLSGFFSLRLLPTIAKCISALDMKIQDQSKHLSPAARIKSGTWTFRAVKPSIHEKNHSKPGAQAFEEYSVLLRSNDQSCEDEIPIFGEGIITNGSCVNDELKITGVARGTSLHFIEEWSGDDYYNSASSCIIDARLSLDGCRFEGVYRNIQNEITGKVAGILNSEETSQGEASCSIGNLCNRLSLVNIDEDDIHRNRQRAYVRCSTLLCMAASRLSFILSRGAPCRDISISSEIFQSSSQYEDMASMLKASPILSCGLSSSSKEDTHRVTTCVEKIFSFDNDSENILKITKSFPWDQFGNECESQSISYKYDSMKPFIEKLDVRIAPTAGGFGSLSLLSPNLYQTTRKRIIASLIHCHRLDFSLIDTDISKYDEGNRFVEIWQTSLQIIESGVRKALHDADVNTKRKIICERHCDHLTSVADFLLQMDLSSMTLNDSEVSKEVANVYASISCSDDVERLKFLMEIFTKQALLCYLSVYWISQFLKQNIKTTAALECLIISITRILDCSNIGRKIPFTDVRMLSATDNKSFPVTVEGCSYTIHRRYSTLVFELFECISKKLFNITSNNDPSIPSIQSLILATLSTFFSSVCRNVYIGMVEGSQLLDLIAIILNDCNLTALRNNLNMENYNISQHEMSSLSYAFLDSARLHSKFHVRKSTMSLLHTIFYYFSGLKSKNGYFTCPIVQNEIIQTLSSIYELSHYQYENNLAQVGFQEYKRIVSDLSKSSMKEADYRNSMGYRYYLQNGVRGIVGNSSYDEFSNMPPLIYGQISLAQEVYLMQLYDVLFLLNCNSRIISLDSLCIKKILESVLSHNEKGTSFPLHVRVRSFRLLRILLPLIDADVTLVKRLFLYSSRLVRSLEADMNYDCNLLYSDANVEIKEMSSLLRSLYLTENWRKVMTLAMIPDEAALDEDDVRHGIQIMFGGLPGLITIGSFVLMKPATVTNLNLNTSSSIKARSMSNSGNFLAGSPNFVFGNGIEGIVTGLSRREATAGIISSIDVKAGTCEIVLVDRNFVECESHLTIRVMKGPLSDTVAVEERSLFIDGDIDFRRISGSTLLDHLKLVETSLDFFNSKCTSDETDVNFRNKIDDDALESLSSSLTTSLLFIRSHTIVLSDKNVLESFVSSNDQKVSNLLLHLLKIASTPFAGKRFPIANAVHGKSLSSLPLHEARFWYLKRLLSNIRARRNAVLSMSESQIIHDSDESSQEVDKSSEKFGVLLTGSEDKYSTPPARQSSTGNESLLLNAVSSTTNRVNSLNTLASDNGDEEEQQHQTRSSRTSHETEFAHLREAAIVQMAELGLPRSWSEYALRRVGGINIEAAVHFCLERGGEMERLIDEDQDRQRSMGSLGGLGRRRHQSSGSDSSGLSQLLRQLVEMGFPPHWCREALTATGHNVDEALTWILTNGQRLSAGNNDDGEYEDEEEDDDEEDSLDESEDHHRVEFGIQGSSTSLKSIDSLHNEDSSGKSVKTKGERWDDTIMCPLRSISGRTNIDQTNLEIAGEPTGGFSSVGMKGLPLTSGKWYYETILITAGCLQIGWADSSFSGHCKADQGDGCGDGPSSWAYDGWRRYRWHSSPTEWGCKWQEGDVVGCLLDMDEKVISFTLNGKGEEIGMGVAFSGDGFRPCGGVYACVSFNRKEKVQIILGCNGTSSFSYGPPPGYLPVGQSIYSFVKERELLLKEEEILTKYENANGLNLSEKELTHNAKQYLCDFSDGQHGSDLFSWQHRYYGSDASVHLGARRKGISKSSSLSRRSNNKINGNGFEDFTDTYASGVNSYMENALENIHESRGYELPYNELCKKDHALAIDILRKCYDDVESDLLSEICDNSLAILLLYARKFILHMTITMSRNFDLRLFRSIESKDMEDEIACRFWSVIESCCSLSGTGWVGEIGAMAIVSEALGLGVSSHEANGSGSVYSPATGVVHGSEKDELTSQLIPAGVITQFLTTVKIAKRPFFVRNSYDPSETIAACAEASIGSDGGGSMIFLKNALQSVSVTSESMRNVIVAIIRRSVRILSVVEYSLDSDLGSSSLHSDSFNEEEDDIKALDESKSSCKGSGLSLLPDARLVCFLTGLLLSEPVRNKFQDRGNLEAYNKVGMALFEGWSVGLLSASSPWRMFCAITASSILSICPSSLSITLRRLPSLAQYYDRLCSIVARRIWAERASIPISSRYLQALFELLCCVRATTPKLLCSGLPVDAATPLPLPLIDSNSTSEVTTKFWEWDECWVQNDSSWQIWSGTVQYHAVDWTVPPKSPVRSLMDGGNGPPSLREGDTVIRGPDWDHPESGSVSSDEDGKKKYDELKSSGEKNNQLMPDGVEEVDDSIEEKKKNVSPKLPVGTVISIEPWGGQPGLGRRVRWHLTNQEGLYRYGGDGGRFDIIHVETNKKFTRIRKRHLPPESLEQCAARYGFGESRRYFVLLRIRTRHLGYKEDDGFEYRCEGVLEWPDFGAGALVDCQFHSDGSVSVTEKRLLFGCKDSGWEARFGQPQFVPGTTTTLSLTKASSLNASDDISTSTIYEELLGSQSYHVQSLRNIADGKSVRVTSEMKLFRCKQNNISNSIDKVSCQVPPPIHFDQDNHPSSISLSRDCRTITCISSEGRGTAFTSVGFTKGIHYWEVKIEQADIGSIFIGVAEKPIQNSSSRGLNKWLGWGFVNFRATYNLSGERVYGAHCHSGDTVGVLLDCDAGRLSFFLDGVKYGEHILNDLGCAFENIAPFGFNESGCGSGGAGQGAPRSDGVRVGRHSLNGAVRPKSLWPVVGLRHPGDRVTISEKWMSNYGVDGETCLRNALKVDELLSLYQESNCVIEKECISSESKQHSFTLPQWFIEESYQEYERWRQDRWLRTFTRGCGPYDLSTYGLSIDVDKSHIACAAACASLGLKYVLLPGDRVSLKRSAGRLLELPEEAEILGSFQGRLWYKLVLHRSEGGSLTEGGGRAWFWDESEVVDDGIQLINRLPRHDIPLPLLNRFICLADGGLRVVYKGGAVIRSDLEIFDGSINIGTIPQNTIIQKQDVLERRVNSCGVVRYRVKYGDIDQGWISSRIRGGGEEAIVEHVDEIINNSQSDNSKTFSCPLKCAEEWFKNFKSMYEAKNNESLSITNVEDFKKLVLSGTFRNHSPLTSDSFLASLVGAIADVTPFGDAVNCEFEAVLSALICGVKHFESEYDCNTHSESNKNTSASQVAATCFSRMNEDSLPSLKSILARIAMLRALNRRVRYALPYLSSRPAQENSAVLGGLSGLGPMVDICGKSLQKPSMESWVQVSSIGTRLRTCKNLFFTDVKKSFLNSLINTTTTPTPLSHDEYELPREVRTIRVNRLKARHAMQSSDYASMKKYSVFSQLKHELRNWTGAALRRGHVAKGHGGQKRAFKVKLVGEGVNDYSGPYREIFTDSIREVTAVNKSGASILNVLQPTPNTTFDVGENRGLFMFGSGHLDFNNDNTIDENHHMTEDEKMILLQYSIYVSPRNETIRNMEESAFFLGKLAATALRHGIMVDLPLPLGLIWSRLCEESVEVDQLLREVDVVALNRLESDATHYYEDKYINGFMIHQQHILNSFADGIAAVIPLEALAIFTSTELRDIFCGNEDIDVDLLHKVVEYEGYTENDAVIMYFWEVLREMTRDERKLFLQFVWARNRMPAKQSDFEAPFKIQKDMKNADGDGCDLALPSASTCFFSLSLPPYSSKEILKEKLLFAIQNVTTMESDYVTNDAEVGEGWRGL